MRRRKSILGLRDQFAEPADIDVATRNNGDNRTFAGSSTESRSERQRARALGDNPCFFSQQPHRVFGFIESDYETTVHDRLHSFPHAREHALAAGAIHEGGFPVWEYLRRTFLE